MPKVKVETKVVKSKTYTLTLTEQEFKYLHWVMGETTTQADEKAGFHGAFGYNFFQPLDAVYDKEIK